MFRVAGRDVKLESAESLFLTIDDGAGLRQQRGRPMKSPHFLKIRARGVEAEGGGWGILALVVVILVVVFVLGGRF